MLIISNGTLLAIQNMTWNGQLGFQTRPQTDIILTGQNPQYAPIFAANGLSPLPGSQGIAGLQVRPCNPFSCL